MDKQRKKGLDNLIKDMEGMQLNKPASDPPAPDVPVGVDAQAAGGDNGETSQSQNAAKLQNNKHPIDEELLTHLKAVVAELSQRKDIEKIRTLSDYCDRKLLVELADNLAPLSTELYNIRNIRTLCSEVKLPEEASTAWSQNLRIASWNIGPAPNALVTNRDLAVLFVLTEVLKLEIIFLQEIRTLNWTKITEVTKDYNYLRLPPTVADNNTLMKGLFILYRKELVDCLCNPSGGTTMTCKHHDNGEVISDGRDCEYAAVSIKMVTKDKQEIIRRLVNFYHATNSVAAKCKENVPVFLSLACQGYSAVIMGDGNFKSTGSAHYAPEIARKLGMSDVMPYTWATFNKQTRIDVVFSNIDVASKELLVHKPIKPYELLNQALNSGVDRRLVAKLKEVANAPKRAKKNSKKSKTEKEKDEYHYIIIAELGEGVNKGNVLHCCCKEDEMSEDNKNMEGSPYTVVRPYNAPKEYPRGKGRPPKAKPNPEGKGKKPSQEEIFHCGEKCRFLEQYLGR